MGRIGEAARRSVGGGQSKGVTVSEFGKFVENSENLLENLREIQGKICDMVFAKPVCPQSTFSSSVLFEA